MGGPEILHRVGERAKKSLARGTLEGWGRYQTEGSVPVLPGIRHNVLSASSTLRTQIDAAAQSVLQGRFAALGCSWPQRAASDSFPPELWRLDPVTGNLWPGADRYCFDVSYRTHGQLGDVKYVWELNRLQFLQVLAAHALSTDDTRAVRAIEAAVDSWYAANPPFRGIAWNSGIELGLRAISLLTVTSLCGDKLAPPVVAKIRTILNAHAVWLARYPSRFSSANNHLVAEAAGEFLITSAMPELPQASSLHAHARTTLVRESTRQILEDGVPAEQSPTYGAFTAELLLLCAAVAKAAGRPLASAVDDRLGRFAHFVGWLANEHAQVPTIGDDDEGRVFTSGQHEPAYAASVAAAIAGYLAEPAQGPRPPICELRDVIFHAPESASVHLGMKTFPDGGYTVIREVKKGYLVQIVLDHGPLGYLSIAAHGHADALAVTAAIDGRAVFIDPGTYLYQSGGPWRDWFRSTPAHNTLNIDGASQSVISGPFNWLHKAATTLENTQTGASWSVTASHDGYVSRFGARHRRTVAATADGFVVRDTLEGCTGKRVEIVFQLAPDCAAQRDGDCVELMREGRRLASLRFDCPGEIALQQGGAIGEGGWCAPSFGQKTPATRISWRGIVPADGVAATVSIGG